LLNYYNIFQLRQQTISDISKSIFSPLENVNSLIQETKSFKPNLVENPQNYKSSNLPDTNDKMNIAGHSRQASPRNSIKGILVRSKSKESIKKKGRVTFQYHIQYTNSVIVSENSYAQVRDINLVSKEWNAEKSVSNIEKTIISRRFSL